MVKLIAGIADRILARDVGQAVHNTGAFIKDGLRDPLRIRRGEGLHLHLDQPVGSVVEDLHHPVPIGVHVLDTGIGRQAKDRIAGADIDGFQPDRRIDDLHHLPPADILVQEVRVGGGRPADLGYPAQKLDRRPVLFLADGEPDARGVLIGGDRIKIGGRGQKRKHHPKHEDHAHRAMAAPRAGRGRIALRGRDGGALVFQWRLLGL